MGYTFSEVDPSDYYTATQTYFASDFSSIAKFVILDSDKSAEEAKEGGSLDVDLMVNNVSFSLAEHNSLHPYLGDMFGVHYYGKSPVTADISAMLIDTENNFSKPYLLQLYKNKLRVRAVAKTKVCPCLVFPGITLQGPLVSMSLVENSESPDTVAVVFRMIVIRLMTTGQEGEQAVFDVSGGEYSDVMLAEAQYGVDLSQAPPNDEEASESSSPYMDAVNSVPAPAPSGFYIIPK